VSDTPVPVAVALADSCTEVPLVMLAIVAPDGIPVPATSIPTSRLVVDDRPVIAFWPLVVLPFNVWTTSVFVIATVLLTDDAATPDTGE